MLQASRLLTVYSCIFLVSAVSAAAIPSLRQNQRQVTKYRKFEDRSHDLCLNSHAASKEPSFLPVVYLSVANSVINVMRPDAAIIWQARVPRALWEICIAFIATVANNTTNPSICLLLCLMMIPTALMDIFVWAPSFAMFANFETCTGGGIFSRLPKECTSDYVTGIGRLFVSVQSLVTGIVYLLAAVMSWTIFAESRDTSIARTNALAMGETLKPTLQIR